MIILSNIDLISCDSKSIKIEINSATTEIVISSVDKISIFTTDKGPFNDDMALAIFALNNVYLIKSEHPLYQHLLFEEIGKALALDYQAIINASSNCSNAEFIIFTGD